MFRVIFPILCVTFGACIGVNSEKNCDKAGILVYEDLGCKVAKKDERGCPVKYECDDFSHKNDSCLFRGKTYTLGEQIDNDLTYGSCSVGCFCENSSGVPRFTCAVLDCPEWLGSKVKPGCYSKFEVDKCCAVGMVCPTKSNQVVCLMDGKTYKEGQRFFPENTCKRCVCDKNWAEDLKSPSCKRLSCNTQINRAEDLANKCAPCYFSKEVLCCPDTWVCPSSTDQITTINSGVKSNSDLSCVFGSKTVKLGEGIRRKVDHFGTERDVQCECVVPPLLTCKEV